MDINSTDFAKFLNDFTEKKYKMLREKEKQEEYGNVSAWDAIITGFSGNLISVHLIGETTVIPDLKNKSGVTNLVIGDEVYLFSISSLSNAFVAVAKNKP